MAAGAPTSPVFNYTSLDFASAKSDLVRYARATFPSELWTDFNDSNFGTFLLDMVAYSTDLLSYTINAQVLETLPLTAVREQNLINIGKTLDYRLRSATGASGQLTLTLTGVGSFMLSKHLQFATAAGVTFQPVVDTPVSVGVTSLTVDIVAGREVYQESLGIATGGQAETYVFAQPYVLDGTIYVYVNGVLYNEVQNIVLAAPTALVYVRTVDDAGYTRITFGDGQNGTLLPIGASITATYKVGGGLESTVAAGTITYVSGDATGAAVPSQIVSVVNTAATSGGGPATSLVQARLELPVSIKANDRAVTAQDYANYAAQVPGVQRATALSGVLIGGSVPVMLFVVPNGGASVDPPQGPTPTLKTQIIAAIAPKKMLSKRVQVQDPAYVRMQVTLDVYAQTNYPADVLYQYVVDALKRKYEPSAVSFGAFLGLQDAYETFNPANNPGVSRVVYRGFTIQAHGGEYVNRAPAGNGAVNWVITDPETVDRREWNIRFTSPTAFQVYERWPGTLATVLSSAVTDTQASYPDDFFTVGNFVLRPRPEEATTYYPVLGNDAQTITVSGNIGGDAVPGDPYVVERKAFTTGKILTTTLTADAAATTTLTIASTVGFAAGDLVVVRDSVSSTASYTIAAVVAVPSSTTITLSTAVTAATGALLSARWQSPNGEVSFVVDAGSEAFAQGDQIYVDTYEPADDIQLRPENFPVLFDSNITVRVIGGVR